MLKKLLIILIFISFFSFNAQSSGRLKLDIFNGGGYCFVSKYGDDWYCYGAYPNRIIELEEGEYCIALSDKYGIGFPGNYAKYYSVIIKQDKTTILKSDYVFKNESI